MMSRKKFVPTLEDLEARRVLTGFDFNDPDFVGKQYGGGATAPGEVVMTEWEIDLSFTEFAPAGTFGVASIEVPPTSIFPPAVNPTPALVLNNVNASFDFSGVPFDVPYVEFDYVDAGGFENLDINDVGIYDGELDAIPPNFFPGFLVEVTPGGLGQVRVTSESGEPIKRLVVGGQEFAIDNLLKKEEIPENHEFFDFETTKPGTEYNENNTKPGQVVDRRWEVGLSFKEFTLGRFSNFGSAQIVAPPESLFPAAENPSQSMSLNNINAMFDYTALPFPVGKVTFDYVDLGGQENLDINGIGRYEGELDAIPPNFFPGFTVNVSTTAVRGGVVGSVEICADPGEAIKSMTVGGQEFAIDNVKKQEAEKDPDPDPEDHPYFDFELVEKGTEYNADNTKPGTIVGRRWEVGLSFKEFTLGEFSNFGSARVDAPPESLFPAAENSSQSLSLNNINAMFDYTELPFPVGKVTFDYVDLGGQENLDINGIGRYEGELDAIPPNFFPGFTVNVTTSAVPGGVVGTVEICAAPDQAIKSMTVGGQEFAIDNVKKQEAEKDPNPDPEDHPYFDFERIDKGTEYNENNTKPQQVVARRWEVGLSFKEFTLGEFSRFGSAQVVAPPESLFPAAENSSQSMTLNNINAMFDYTALPFPVGKVTFDFVDLGGEENLDVNGLGRYEGDLAAIPPNFFPGFTVNVTTSAVPGGVVGTVEICAAPGEAIKSMTVGGQEFAIDDVKKQEAEKDPDPDPDPDPEDLPYFDFELVEKGTEYNADNTKPGTVVGRRWEVELSFKEFTLGEFSNFGSARVDAPPESLFPAAENSSQSLSLNNINAMFDYTELPFPVGKVTFDYVDLGGQENLDINGIGRYEGELDAIPPNFFPGFTVNVTTSAVPGGVVGTVEICADPGEAIKSMTVGGQEFAIDNVKKQEAEKAPDPDPEDHPYFDFESIDKGTEYNENNTKPQQVVARRWEVGLSFKEFTLGEFSNFGSARVDAPPESLFPAAENSSQSLSLNNINAMFDYTELPFPVGKVTFDYVDLGGQENLDINGIGRYEGELDAIPPNFFPGFTVNVTTSAVPGGVVGTVEICADPGEAIKSMTVGGQEFAIDNVKKQEAEKAPDPDPEDHPYFDFESIDKGTEYNENNTKPQQVVARRWEVGLSFKEFTLGEFSNFGSARVDAPPESLFPAAENSSQSLSLNNINAMFDYTELPFPVGKVTFDYVDLGGQENLDINGIGRYEGELDAIPPNFFPGFTVNVTTSAVPGGVVGTVEICADPGEAIKSMTVGGQEFAIDNVKKQEAEKDPNPDPEDHPYFDFEGIDKGTEYNENNTEAGQVVARRWEVGLSFKEFTLGTFSNYGFAQVTTPPDSFFPPAVNATQTLLLNNINAMFDYTALPFPVGKVKFDYVDLGGQENLDINGIGRYEGELDAIPPNFFPGFTVTVTTSTASGGVVGTVEICADAGQAIESVTVGGQEFAIDNVMKEESDDPTPKLASFGDFDGDGVVSFLDFLLLAQKFGQEVEPCTNGDTNGDGIVNFADFIALANFFGQQVPPASPAATDNVFQQLGEGTN